MIEEERVAQLFAARRPIAEEVAEAEDELARQIRQLTAESVKALSEPRARLKAIDDVLKQFMLDLREQSGNTTLSYKTKVGTLSSRKGTKFEWPKDEDILKFVKENFPVLVEEKVDKTKFKSALTSSKALGPGGVVASPKTGEVLQGCKWKEEITVEVESVYSQQDIEQAPLNSKFFDEETL